MIYAFQKLDFKVELYNDLIRQVKIVSSMKYTHIQSLIFQDDPNFYYLIYDNY